MNKPRSHGKMGLSGSSFVCDPCSGEHLCKTCGILTYINRTIKCKYCFKRICENCSQSDSCKKCFLLNLKRVDTKKILKADVTMDFVNKIVVITGRLKSMKRKHAESLVITSGGDVGSTVSRNTDFVVVGENPGSKLDRAQELGIRIVTEEEFLNWAQPQPSVIQTITVKKKKRRILL